MTETEFQWQMNRLLQTYGKAAYPEERVKMVWQIVCDLSGDWFKKVCDDLIANERHAPMGPAFSHFACEEREREYRIKKSTESRDAAEFWAGTYHSDEVAVLAETIKRRMQGKVSDEDWSKFMKMVNRVGVK